MKKEEIKLAQHKENLLSILRAMSKDEELQIDFNADLSSNFFNLNHRNLLQDDLIILPEIIDETRYFKARALADLAVAYQINHQKSLQKNSLNQEEQRFFDEFEKARVICEIKNSYYGAAKNILTKIEEDIFSDSANLSLILLAEFFTDELLPRTKNAVLELHQNLNKKIVQAIKNLAKITHDQKKFTQEVENILELLRQDQQSLNDKGGEESQEKNPNSADEEQNDLQNFGTENSPQQDENNFTQNNDEDEEKIEKTIQEITDLKEDDVEGETTVKLDKQGSKEDKIEFKNPYKVYTTKFDEVVFPEKLTNKNELEFLRDQLDLKMQKLSGISKKMTFKLKRKLLSRRDAFLEPDSTRGVINRKKLTRLVIDPLIEDIWINQKHHEYHDTALTILLDNSGSMRGNPIVMSALACEIIAEILEKFSVKTEIIGFTTADWKGGRAKKLWESSGRPHNPGRLNELRHIIYKHFNQRFKKAKNNLGLMLKEGVLKENIDGEALLFARARLMQRSEKRKILMVISDGTPVDDSTNSVNDKDILTDHLHHVINKIEKGGKIEIIGVGIGHATDEFYHNSIAIKSLEDLGDAMIEKISEVL